MIKRNSKGQFVKGSVSGSRGNTGKKGKEKWLKATKRLRERGPKSPFWKGGRAKKQGGYVAIYSPNHPNAVYGGGQGDARYVLEHRLVMEKHLGRYLERWEEVHHRNGIKDDNRLENLELVINQKHFGKVRCPYCSEEFLIK